MEKKHLNNETFRVNSSSMFLDIFFSKDETAKRISKQERKRAFFKLLRILAILIPVLMIAGFAKENIPNSPKRRLKTMLAQKRYSDYLTLANQMLDAEPENSDLREAAANVLLSKILEMGWIVKLECARFTEAREILADASEQSKQNPDGLKIIKLLHWVTDIEAHFSKRKPEIALTLFRDEIQTDSLLTRWSENKTDIRELFKQIMDENPSEQLQDRVYSHLNTLQTQKIRYFEVIRDFKQKIETKLDADHHPSLVSIIDEFERKYPGIGGINALREDLSGYLRLRQKVSSKQWAEIPGLLDKLEFQTRFFIDRVSRLLEETDQIYIRSDAGHTGVVLLAKRKWFSLKDRVLSESSEKNYR